MCRNMVATGCGIWQSGTLLSSCNPTGVCEEKEPRVSQLQSLMNTLRRCYHGVIPSQLVYEKYTTITNCGLSLDSVFA